MHRLCTCAVVGDFQVEHDFGGQSFGAETDTGALDGQSNNSAVDPVAGRCVVTAPAASAAMLVAH